jgi:hypothetical protein
MPSESVNLKEFLLGKMADLNEVRDVKQNALAVELRNEAKLKEVALELQAKEYERRLEGLNHENQRILTAAAKAVSNEKFDGFEREFHEYKVTNEKTVNEKADALKTLVNEKAEALRTLVGEKAETLSVEFRKYREENDRVTERARGLKMGSSRVLTLVVAIVGFLWALSAVTSTVLGIYSYFAPKPPIVQAAHP